MPGTEENIAKRYFDDIYSADVSHFGSRPSVWLPQIVESVERRDEKRCLDLGCGHGRNTFYLARRGFEVTAVDNSRVATAFLEKKASALGLPIRVVCDNIKDFELKSGWFDLLVMVTVMGSLRASHLCTVTEKIAAALRPGGVLAVEEFSPNDPGADGGPGASEFAHLVTNYFTCADIQMLFDGLEQISCRELSRVDSAHGNRHRHSLVRYVGRKK